MKNFNTVLSFVQNNLSAVSIVAAGLVVATSILFNNVAVREAQYTEAQWQRATLQNVESGGHLLGSPDAPVKVVLFMDLECPFCKKMHSRIPAFLRKYAGQIAFIFRHYPLTELHPNARLAAEAAECVAHIGGENAFWKYIDAFYLGAALPTPDTYSSLAQAVGVSPSEFEHCRSSGEVRDIIESDMRQGYLLNISVTPSQVIIADSKLKIIPGSDPTPIYRAIDEALQAIH